MVSGIGATKAERHGHSLLRIIADPSIVDEEGGLEAPAEML